jgi:hypothetical protein
MDAIVQPTTNKTLYVKKDGSDYMVSHLPLGGYEKYDGENGCWTSADGVSSFGTATITEEHKNEYILTEGSDKEPVLDTNVKCTLKEKISRTLVSTALNKLTTLGFPRKKETYYFNITRELLTHINIRFAYLNCLLETKPSLKVVIAGDDGKHNLGSNLARGQWELKRKEKADLDNADKKILLKNKNAFILETNYNKTFNGKCYDIVIEFINEWCKSLIDTYKGHVTYGIIGIDKGMDNTHIHVWGANIKNFNKSNDKGGGGQANAVRYNKADPKTNAAGAFGIITTPIDATTEALADSNMDLIETSFAMPSVGGSNPHNRTRSKKRRNSRKSK